MNYSFLLETGDHLLKEDGYKLLLDNYFYFDLSKDIGFKILNENTVSLNLEYVIDSYSKSINLDLVYKILNEGNANVDIDFKVLNEKENNVSLSFKVKTEKDIDKDIKYNIKLIQDLTKDIFFRINALKEINLSSQYALLKTYDKNIDLSYYLKFVYDLSKSISYYIYATKTLSLDLKYVISYIFQHRLKIPMEYKIKECRYSSYFYQNKNTDYGSIENTGYLKKEDGSFLINEQTDDKILLEEEIASYSNYLNQQSTSYNYIYDKLNCNL